ncbi:MAG: MMPL family transporter [Fidelibacterota bacterium]
MKSEERMMTAIAAFVTRFYKWIPFVALLLFILSIIAASNIETKTEIKDLMSEKDPLVASYIEVDSVFAGGATVMITIEGSDKARMGQCAEDFVAAVRANDRLMEDIKAINLKIDRQFIDDWGLMLQKARDIEKTAETFAELNLLPFITSLNNSFEETYTGDEAEEELETNKQENEAVAMLSQLETFFTLLREYLENPELSPVEEQGKILAETFLYGEPYQFNHDNSMLLFTFSPAFSAVEFDKIFPMMDAIKAIQADMNAKYPDLHISYTGDIPVQSDEQDALSFDMAVPSIVALILILVLFIFSFSQLRSILFILIVLILGIVFNYGFIGVTIKEINMLTSIMGVLLIGLGVDYGIQIVTNFTTYREDGLEPQEALRLTYQKAGMGTLLAALTTALAFFVMSATGVKAFEQFGIIMGTGIINCFLAMFFILPAMLLWWGKKDVSKTHLPNIDYQFLATLGNTIYKHRTVTIIAGIVVTAGFFAAMFLNRIEYDIMKLEPQDMPSIIQYNKVMEKFEMTPFASMVIAESIEEAREMTEKLEKTPMVADINSVSYFFPPADKQKARLAAIAEIRKMPQRYQTMNYTAEDMESFVYEVQRTEWNIIEMGDLSVAGLGENNQIVKKRNAMIREIFGAEVGKPGREVFQKLIKLIESDPALYAERLAKLDRYFAKEADAIVTRMSQAKRLMTIDDLPEPVRKSMFDETGTRNLVMIYPDEDVLDNIDRIRHFNNSVARVSPRITGSSQILTAWMNEVTNASGKAGIYIFAAVLFFLILNFRNFKYVVFASVPLVLGLIWMAGMYPLLGQKLNIINIAVIPLVIGMGIDFGIHITHRFRVEQNIETVYRYTGKGVFLAAFTTMIGFGSLGLIGKFGSVNSMGRILFVGILSCLLTTLIILPAFLTFAKKKQSS